MNKKELKQLKEMLKQELGIKSVADLARKLGMSYNNAVKYIKVGDQIKPYWIKALELSHKITKEKYLREIKKLEKENSELWLKLHNNES